MLIVFLILLDQLSKYLIRFRGGFYICNPGISFGLRMPSGIFWIFWIAIIGFLLYIYYKPESRKHKAARTGLMLVISGAISNIIDRLTFGCVIDFINLKVWPVFNLADIFIFFGAIIIMTAVFKNKKINSNFYL